MNDASEVLAVIFDCLHRTYTSAVGAGHAESEESNSMGSWDCTSNACIAHNLFGMDIHEQMNCHSCGLESRHLKYTSFFHNLNANALRTMKVYMSQDFVCVGSIILLNTCYSEKVLTAEEGLRLLPAMSVGKCRKYFGDMLIFFPSDYMYR